LMAERKNKIITKTKEFKEILYTCGLWEKACTVIFQALRIEVNQELQNLKTALSKLEDILSEGWRCSVISYHSLEDRIVKYFFKDLVANWKFKLINKKVVVPHYLEVKKNRASRSAKLRVIEFVG
jgi:16S rRNA (cytosine1402-N4)-methyltransferase